MSIATYKGLERIVTLRQTAPNQDLRRQYNTSSFISTSEGLVEISFASTLDALLTKRLTNDNSFKTRQR